MRSVLARLLLRPMLGMGAKERLESASKLNFSLLHLCFCDQRRVLSSWTRRARRLQCIDSSQTSCGSPGGWLPWCSLVDLLLLTLFGRELHEKVQDSGSWGKDICRGRQVQKNQLALTSSDEDWEGESLIVVVASWIWPPIESSLIFFSEKPQTTWKEV